jgi:serine phosphatase RsbU (regulator of sigma subunit)
VLSRIFCGRQEQIVKGFIGLPGINYATIRRRFRLSNIGGIPPFTYTAGEKFVT